MLKLCREHEAILRKKKGDSRITPWEVVNAGEEGSRKAEPPSTNAGDASSGFRGMLAFVSEKGDSIVNARPVAMIRDVRPTARPCSTGVFTPNRQTTWATSNVKTRGKHYFSVRRVRVGERVKVCLLLCMK